MSAVYHEASDIHYGAKTREIVSISIGGGGNAIGQAFWKIICEEHGICANGAIEEHATDANYLQYSGCYFLESATGRFVPRSILCDLDHSSINAIIASPWGELFDPQSMIYEQHGSSNSFSKGSCTIGPTIIEKVMVELNRKMEQCQNPQGMQLSHTLGGGTGSGFTALLLTNIKELAPKILVKTYSLFPHGELTSACTENYNAVLALHHLQENADMCVCFDNHMLCNLIQKKLDVLSPTYGDFNYLIGLVMGGVTACMRFPQFWTTDYRKILNNIVPAPHMHFLVPSYAPIMKNINWKAIDPKELTMPMMKAENNMLQTNENGKYIAASLIYRGQNLSPYVIDKTLEAFQDLKRESFIEWTPYQLHTTICRGLQNTCTLTMLANMTNIEGVFGGMIDQFQKMFDKKSYLQWYIDESKGGSMTEEQFTDARDALVNLRELYVQLNNESPLE